MVDIYFALHLESGRLYFGKSQDWIKRWRCHKSIAKNHNNTKISHFHRAIRLYGPDSFAVQKIAEAVDHKSASELEKFYIKEFNTTDAEFGFNLTRGGDGMPATPETAKKISEAHKAKGTRPPGTAGLVRTPEWLRNISEGRKGIPAWNKGKKLSAEHCYNLSLSHRKELPLNEIYELRKKGFSCAAIGEDFGVSYNTISRRLKEAGFEIKIGGYYRRPSKT